MEETTSRVEFVYSEQAMIEKTVALLAEGYEEQDEGEGICFGGVYVGRVFARFTPWNVAYDFVIVSVIPE